MSTATGVSATQREPELPGQTVVIGGSSGIGLGFFARLPEPPSRCTS
jgi:hypothetical protein